MLTLNFISARGGVLPLAKNENFWLQGADGMTLASTSISSNTVPTMDGDTVNNVQANYRAIVLYLEIKPGNNVEDVKRYIMSYVKPKLRGTLKWTQNGRELQISGIVESIEMPRFSDKCIMQITLHCAQPYWEDIEALVAEISLYVDMHYFPAEQGGLAFPADGIPFGVYDQERTKTFTNHGDVSVGMTISIRALSTVTNPVLYDLVTGKYIGVNTTMDAGDDIIITTEKGNKNITKNGEIIVDKIKPGSTWLQIEPGDNEFQINSDDADTSNMYFSITFKRRYV